MFSMELHQFGSIWFASYLYQVMNWTWIWQSELFVSCNEL